MLVEKLTYKHCCMVRLIFLDDNKTKSSFFSSLFEPKKPLDDTKNFFSLTTTCHKDANVLFN
jgi:hypothetical protein